MNVRARWLTAAAALTCLLLGARARAAPLGLGVYLPDLRLTPYQTFGLARQIARHLATALGHEVRGLAYKNFGDLSRDLKARRLQFAVLGAFNAATSPGKILASAKLASPGDMQWTLLCKSKRSLASLRGKVLQLPRVGGLVNGLVQNGLLGGNLSIAHYFKIAYSPSLSSSVEAVRLGQAQAVFAPISTPGLTPILERTITVPPPAFVLVDASLPAERAQRAAEAMLARRGDEVIVGWEAEAAAYSRFSRMARREPLRMQMVTPARTRLRHADLIDTEGLAPELPVLDELFVAP